MISKTHRDTATEDVAAALAAGGHGRVMRINDRSCGFCDDHLDDKMMPPHTASPNCESGKRNHCTCGVCY